MSFNPAMRFNINMENHFSDWDLDKKYKINSTDFISKGKSTPFEGYEVYGENLLTVMNGKIVYKK